jgi:hypothetical protein
MIESKKKFITGVCIGVALVVVGSIILSGVSSTLVYAVINCFPSCPINQDPDHDGIINEDEIDTYHTNPRIADTDHDGLSDGSEVYTSHTNPLNPDNDGDGLFDGKEVNGWYLQIDEGICPQSGFTCTVYHTNPLSPDTDGDGCSDYWEWANPSDPLNPNIPSPTHRWCTDNKPVVNSQTLSIPSNKPIKITLTGSDQDHDSLTFKILSQPSSGKLGAVIPTGPTSAQVNYTPLAGLKKTVSFAYVAYDGLFNGNTGTITINVK